MHFSSIYIYLDNADHSLKIVNEQFFKPADVLFWNFPLLYQNDLWIFFGKVTFKTIHFLKEKLESEENAISFFIHWQPRNDSKKRSTFFS